MTLMRIFGSKREDATVGWRKLHTEEIHKLYSTPNRVIMSQNLDC
jgi:hypothetical protein